MRTNLIHVLVAFEFESSTKIRNLVISASAAAQDTSFVSRSIGQLNGVRGNQGGLRQKQMCDTLADTLKVQPGISYEW